MTEISNNCSLRKGRNFLFLSCRSQEQALAGSFHLVDHPFMNSAMRQDETIYIFGSRMEGRKMEEKRAKSTTHDISQGNFSGAATCTYIPLAKNIVTWPESTARESGKCSLCLEKCELGTSSSVCHRRVWVLLRRNSDTFCFILSVFFSVSQYACLICDNFKEIIFEKRKKTSVKEILRSVIVVIAFQCWGYKPLHLYVSLYFQIWLKWECSTLTFSNKSSLPHLHYTFPHNKGKKGPSHSHPRRSGSSFRMITLFFFHRATAFGILNGLCKFGAILGNTIFASFVGITKVVPILLAAASLVGGGLIALRLPETREQVLMWTTSGERKWWKNLIQER